MAKHYGDPTRIDYLLLGPGGRRLASSDYDAYDDLRAAAWRRRPDWFLVRVSDGAVLAVARPRIDMEGLRRWGGDEGGERAERAA